MSTVVQFWRIAFGGPVNVYGMDDVVSPLKPMLAAILSALIHLIDYMDIKRLVNNSLYGWFLSLWLGGK